MGGREVILNFLAALNTADGMQKAAAGLRARITKGNRGSIEIYQNVNHHA
jgi:hypothetical protein